MDVSDNKSLNYDFFDRYGKITNDENISLCKSGYSDGTGRKYYWIRQNTIGLFAGGFIDITQHYEDLQSKNRQKGTLNYPFQKVSKVSFENYLEFLRCGNQAMLRVAERLRNE